MSTPEAASTPENERQNSLAIAWQLYQSMVRPDSSLSDREIKAREKITTAPDVLTKRAAELGFPEITAEYAAKAGLPEVEIFQLLSQAEAKVAERYGKLAQDNSQLRDYYQLEAEHHAGNAEIFRAASQALAKEGQE